VVKSIRIQPEEMLHYLREFYNKTKAWITVNMFKSMLQENNSLILSWYSIEKILRVLEREGKVEHIPVYGYGSGGHTEVWKPTEMVGI